MTKAETITPLGFNVLVEIVEHENKTKSGLFLPKNDDKEIRSELVKIITYGKNAFTDCYGNQDLPPSDQSYALIQRNTGQPFMSDDKSCRLVQSDHILGVMDGERAIKYCEDNFNFKLNLNDND